MIIRKAFTFGLACLILLCVLTACGGATSSSPSTPLAKNEAQLEQTSFSPASITIKKGESVKLLNPSGDMHIIANGSWQNGSTQPANESGAPKANNLQTNGNDTLIIGPFTSAGTFQYYCTIHSGMNLTIVVQ